MTRDGDQGQDPWRQRVDAATAGRSRSVNGVGRTRGAGFLGFLAGLGLLTLVAIVVVAVLAVFPLAREQRADPCGALESLLARRVEAWTQGGAGTPGTTKAAMPDASLAEWFQCYVIYWRRLEVPGLEGREIARAMTALDRSVALVLIGAGVLLAGVAVVVRRRRRRPDRVGEVAFGPPGTEAGPVPARPAWAPVDLSKPIMGEAAWMAVRAHASDGAYRRAVETVRLRYQLVGNQMLLPSTLRETMSRFGLGFREAMIRIAEDDGIGGRR